MRSATARPVVQRWLRAGRDHARWRGYSCTARATGYNTAGTSSLMGGGGIGGPGAAGRGSGGDLGRRVLGPGCWRGLLGRVRTLQPVALRPPPDAVSLRLLDARGVARNTYAHRQGELEALFIGQAELAGQFVYPDFLGQVPRQYLSSFSSSVLRPAGRYIMWRRHLSTPSSHVQRPSRTSVQRRPCVCRPARPGRRHRGDRLC